nr:TetR/AcrR family transcriptional regulator [Streptococcus sp. DD11]
MTKRMVRKPVQKRSIDKLNLILSVSKELFSNKNYFNVTTNEIAKEAGISIGTLYSYFSNKDEILSVILKNYNESFIVIFNQLNTTENFELFRSDYRSWIEQLIENLIKIEDREFHAQIEMLSYTIPEVKEIQNQHNSKMKELTYQCLLYYVDGNEKIENLRSVSNVLFNFITSIVDDILYSPHSNEEIISLKSTALDCISLILENLIA